MDRNLGAESTATSDVVSKGLYFQWGRKDPFIYPKENRKSDNKTPATTWNLQGYEFEVHSHYTGNYPLSDYSIAWSLEHPTSFIGSAPNPAGSNPVYFSTWLVDYSPYLWGYPSGKRPFTIPVLRGGKFLRPVHGTRPCSRRRRVLPPGDGICIITVRQPHSIPSMAIWRTRRELSSIMCRHHGPGCGPAIRVHWKRRPQSR